MKKPINLSNILDDQIYLQINCLLRTNIKFMIHWRVRAHISTNIIPEIGIQLNRQLSDKLTEQIKEDLNK